MSKQNLLDELKSFETKMPKGLASWDSHTTSRYKAALKEAMGKKKSNEYALELALRVLRPFYKES